MGLTIFHSIECEMNYNDGTEYTQCLSHSGDFLKKKMLVFFIITLVSYHEH